MTTADPAVEEMHRLSRPHEGRIVAGVCKGAGDYFDVDPVIFRVLLAVLAFFGGAGVLIYAVAWLLIPETGSPTTRLERWLDGHQHDRRRDLVIVAGVLFALVFLTNRHPFAHPLGGVVLVVLLALAVAAGLGRVRAARPRAGDPAVARQPADYSGPLWSAPTSPRRPRSWLGWLTLGAALLAAGAVSLAAVTGAAHPQPAEVLAVSVAVIGLGLIVGAFAGRAWSMIPLGLLLVGGLVVTAALPRNLTWTAGDREWTPVTVPAAAYVLGAGHATLDLTLLPSDTPATVISRIGAGNLRVLVPPGRSLVVHAHVGAGEIRIFGDDHSGVGRAIRQDVIGRKPAQGVLTLDLNVGYGEVEIQHAAA